MDASFKPYLIRAVYEWCADKGFNPYLAVAVDSSCKVPNAYVRDGQIVLDISMNATHQLELGLDSIRFQARFGGVAQHLFVPMHRVLGVFPEHDQTLGAFFAVTDAPLQADGDAQGDEDTDANTDANGPADSDENKSENAPQRNGAAQISDKTAATPRSVGKSRITRVK
jgi:stringent starvation protein B